jgi:hypothetical protein
MRHIGGGFTAPFIVKSTDAEVRGQLHCPAALLAKEPTLSIEEEVGWAPESVWTLRRRDKYLVSVRNRTTIPRASGT